MKKKIYLYILLILMTFLLTGCVSDAKKNKMFDLLVKNGCIDVGGREWDQYDDEEIVNQAPIPMNIHYYIYKTDKYVYTIDYSSMGDDRENVESYKARVDVEMNGQYVETIIYVFEYRKIIGPFWKMYYMGPK